VFNNKVQKKLSKQLKQLKANEIDKKTEEIEALKDNAKTFQGVKNPNTAKPTALIIKKEDATIAQPDEAAEIVVKYFKSLFYKTSTTTNADEQQQQQQEQQQQAKPLIKPIGHKEVKDAVKKLRNNRATGHDGMPGELLIHILGIDMSRAFDTIDKARNKLMAPLKEIIDDDIWRMVQALLDNTILQAKIKNATSAPFTTNTSAP
ncbi:unnamed protein product, partial [Didymodactylos carnosus]